MSEEKTVEAVETRAGSESAPQPVPRPEPRGAAAPRHVRLTDRDRQLMGMLATVRYLSLAQLARLLFAERSTINLHKRLLALAGEGRHGVKPPFLRQLKYRSWAGMPQTAWTLTTLGYAVAASVLPSPPRKPTSETGANFIEHGLLANELYVQLLEAPLQRALAEARRRAQRDPRPQAAFDKLKAGLYARATLPGFRWLAHDEVHLQWQLQVVNGKSRAREILPDATLEVPGPVIRETRWTRRAYAGRRLFLEAETGSHSIWATSDEKPGATINKLKRYESFCLGLADAPIGARPGTLYEQHYPDGYEPTVLFMVRTEGRAEALLRAFEKHRREGTYRELQLNVLAMTPSAAMAHVAAALGAAPPPIVPSRRINSAELTLLHRFTSGALAVMKKSRADARAFDRPIPDYPPGHEDVLALHARIALRGSQK